MINQHKKTALISGVLIGLLFLGALLSYAFHSRYPISSTVKKIYPAAIVGGRIVSINEAESAYDIARRLDDKATFDQAFEQLIKIYQQESLLRKLDIKLDSNDIPDEFTYLTKGKSEEYSSVLDTYFSGNENTFYKHLVYPQVYEAKLRMKYNSDFSRNAETYDKAKSVLSQIKAGDDFANLAKIHSDDEFTGQIGGDLGFFEHGQILPELEREITISAMGEVKNKVVISRLGYHIVYPVETSQDSGKKLWHAKHILISTEGFETWQKSELEKIKVWKILR
jgi:hypothetical protein